METRGVGGDERPAPEAECTPSRSATIVRTGKENNGRVHWLIHINSIQQYLQLPPLASSPVSVVLVQISETSRDFHIRVRVGVDVENL